MSGCGFVAIVVGVVVVVAAVVAHVSSLHMVRRSIKEKTRAVVGKC